MCASTWQGDGEQLQRAVWSNTVSKSRSQSTQPGAASAGHKAGFAGLVAGAAQASIRNFCIIAHIDHGKSTLADRLLELTGTVEKRQLREQMLDRMDLERERGITIKLAPVRMKHKDYELNLIDTPGHVDFSYEVSRSLAAVEGAILVVDASQGIQAQTLSNIYLALAADLTIIPVLNKIDLPAADVERVSEDVVKLLGCKKEDILLISAKTGQGVEKVLERVIADVPPPSGETDSTTRALIFDSYYDDYRGVILYTRVIDGAINKDDTIKMLGSKAEGLALEVGSLTPDMKSTKSLNSGEIGYIVTNLKSTLAGRVGDTITLANQPSDKPLSGYKEIHPFVYAGFFPTSNQDYQTLKEAVDKLSLSDSSLQFSPENSPVLGFGLRLGFLGLLHMDIVRERLQREYNLDLIVTNPSTDYHVKLTNGESLDIKSAAELPELSSVAEIHEPWIRGEVVTPTEYVGVVLQLIIGARGEQKKLDYVDAKLAVIDFEAPLANLITDFYDQLKSVTSGYGSFGYGLADYRLGDLVRVDFYVGGEKVDALSVIVHRTEAERVGRSAVEKLKKVIPRQQFKVSLQAAVGGKFIARGDISAYRKDVTTGLYGGDVTRKKKVLAKQKKGKQRMKKFGKVEIPSEAFSVLLRRD
ncbi:MAG: Elongation factor 4 [Candidatus Saccharibacteria bacterium GW2011_GWA2_46_10]|nr:MAG: Elongation factor 4 [Candidatus Saccharibacteria bacterium GW2011_GWA2_46_10]